VGERRCDKISLVEKTSKQASKQKKVKNKYKKKNEKNECVQAYNERV
jgi:hypothetical protein